MLEDSSKSMHGRLLVQFTTIILMNVMRKKLKVTGLNEKYSLRASLLEMKSLTRIDYSGRIWPYTD
ncbi:hypothetical protein [Mesotoga sp.]|uniref:hypothetical protein n=1 Tax=Mesotoga sp. TaxID=2053577 RepID=UPI00345ED4D5